MAVRIALACPILCLALACAADANPADATDGSSGAGSSTGSHGSTGGADDDTPGTTAAPATETGASTGAADSSTGAGETGIAGGECNVFAQDCPDGMKCMPWADDGGGSWNADKCVEIAANPNQVGDPCLVESSGVSGVDDCDHGLMCYNVDATTNTGTCYELCGGSAAAPTCTVSGGVCAIYNDGVLPLCLTACDPLQQDCPGPQQLCVASPGNDGFVCILDSLPGSDGGFGAPCEFANACDPGYFCGVMSIVPGCTNGGGCCSGFCDLGANDPDAQCEGQAGGQTCQPWWNQDAPAPGYEDVGYCGIPS